MTNKSKLFLNLPSPPHPSSLVSGDGVGENKDGVGYFFIKGVASRGKGERAKTAAGGAV